MPHPFVLAILLLASTISIYSFMTYVHAAADPNDVCSSNPVECDDSNGDIENSTNANSNTTNATATNDSEFGLSASGE